MRIFDLHCDTLTRALERGETLRHATGHVSLARGALLEAWTQVFAVFVPDALQGQTAADYCDRAIAFYHAQHDEISAVCKPILAIENGNALMGDLHRLDELAAKRVKIITLTWNGENELGYGCACDPRSGLKAFGRQAIVRMFELGIWPDVSHLNEAGFWEMAELGRPLLATHSSCAVLQPHRRNLDDAQLRAVFASGGLVGLCLHDVFLGNEGTAEEVARHLAHMLALGGEDCVALGSDFDGCTIHPSLAGIEKLPGLNENLARLGFDAAMREKLFYSNAAKFFAL